MSAGQSQATNTPSLFGGFSTPAFGASAASTPAFGAASGSAFGFGASTPAFGAASTPAFGAASTGAPSIFGSTPAFGAASSSAFSFAGLPIDTLPFSLMLDIAFVLHMVITQVCTAAARCANTQRARRRDACMPCKAPWLLHFVQGRERPSHAFRVFPEKVCHARCQHASVWGYSQCIWHGHPGFAERIWRRRPLWRASAAAATAGADGARQLLR